MVTTLFGMGVIVLAMIGLGLGVLAGRGALHGSCGGLSCAGCTGCRKRRDASDEERHDD